MLPKTSLFLYMYVRKEAVLSSMIEGTQSSLSDLLLFELDEQPGVPLDDVREVSNYVAALDHGLHLLQQGMPLSLRMLREVHGVLLSKGRGSNQTPGEFRHSQNWIGGARPGNAGFVPPPAEAVLECMSKLELFLHDQPEPTPVLLKAALAHVQFETIHPFLESNGRLGRLLIALTAVVCGLVLLVWSADRFVTGAASVARILRWRIPAFLCVPCSQPCLTSFHAAQRRISTSAPLLTAASAIASTFSVMTSER